MPAKLKRHPNVQPIDRLEMAERSTSIVLAALGAAIFAASCGPDDSKSERALAIMANDPALTWGPCPELFPGECKIAVLHGDPSKANADVFLRVPPQYEIPAHWHTSAERMVLVTGELQVTYKGQPPSTLSAGNYAYGPAKLPHKASCVSSDACTLFIAFETPVDAHAFDGTLE